jgi:hypothetical protein
MFEGSLKKSFYLKTFFSNCCLASIYRKNALFSEKYKGLMILVGEKRNPGRSLRPDRDFFYLLWPDSERASYSL